MLPTSYFNLYAKLMNGTSKQKINWHPTADPNCFLAEFSNSSVSISSVDNLLNPYYQLTIYDANGDKLETLTIDDFKDDNGYTEVNLYQLYHDARRSALGVTKAIDSIVDELSKSDEFEF